MIFPDMPWILDPIGAVGGAREAVERAFPGRGGSLTRLYAFGYDAFRLANELPRLRSGGSGYLPGATGRLMLDADGRVRRELDWAQIVAGHVAPWPPPAPLAAPAP